jgi:Zn-dependent protease
MSWSITIARVAGTEVRIHMTFLILLAWIGIVNYVALGGAGALAAVVFIIAVFACVVLHELGHAVAANFYGIKTTDITLLPIGGLARLARMPDRPGEEIVIAIAGPLVNVVIALVLILGLGLALDPDGMAAALTEPGAGFFARLAAINIFLVLFNLIPAFPMDGGRVLRALLSIWLGRRRATDIAARVGQALAFVFGFLGLMVGNAILVFIAIFVYLAATAEAGLFRTQGGRPPRPDRGRDDRRLRDPAARRDRRRRRQGAAAHHAARIPGRRRRRAAPRRGDARRSGRGDEGAGRADAGRGDHGPRHSSAQTRPAARRGLPPAAGEERSNRRRRRCRRAVGRLCQQREHHRAVDAGIGQLARRQAGRGEPPPG